MGVKFKTYSSGGGSPTSFTDSLTGIAGPLDPSLWAQGVIAITPIVTPVSWGSMFLTGTAGTSTMQGTANPNVQLFNYACPTSVIAGVYGKTQFAQVTFQGSTGVANNHWGPIVCFKPSAMPIGYWFRNIHSTPQLDLVRNAPNGGSTPGTSMNQAQLVGGINGNTLNVGDVMRISVDFTVPAAPVITCKINGVQVAQFTDNAAPLSGGTPALLATHHDGNYTFSNWSCGLGL